jgi:hypothetical protein
MKRILLILFLIGGGLFTAQADTIGYYRATIQGKVVANISEFHRIRINLKSDSLSVTDTLQIDHFSCGYRMAGTYQVLIRDSITNEIVYNDTLNGMSFRVPLHALIEWKSDNRGSVFKGSFIPVNSRSTRATLFEIKLE